MAVNFANAVAAYRNAVSQMGNAGGMEPRQGADSDFAGLVKQGLNQTVQALNAGEQASAAAVTGKAELADVVSAVSNAELTLQTAVAVRDKVIQAYQEIIRMPI